MKNQKPAVASPKARRKRTTIALSPDAELAYHRIVERLCVEDLAHHTDRGKARLESDPRFRHKNGRAAQRLIELAFQAALEHEGPLTTGWAWWKFQLAQMSNEEAAARCAMIDAEIDVKYKKPLQPISDEQEAAAIAALNAKAAAQPAKPDKAALYNPTRVSAILVDSDNVGARLFSFKILEAGREKIAELLESSPETRIGIRFERGESDVFSGWYFEAADSDTEE